jgi:hypothetical protein
MLPRQYGVIVLAALAGLALPHAATAQLVRGWGVKGGLVGAYQSFSYVSGFGSPAIPRTVRWGYSAGLFVEFLNEGIVSIAIEGAYTQKGRRVTAEEITRAPGEQPYLSAGPEGITPWLGYVSTSLSVKVRTGSRGTRPYFFVGPRFDFLVSRPAEPAPVFTGFKTHDIGINIGLGLEVAPRRRPALSFEVRWSPGFSRVFSNDAVGIKNATFDFLLAVWL